MAKRVSSRLVKIHHSYDYREAAELLDVTSQTIRSWREEGLLVLTDTLPHLILGFALKDFIDKRNAKAKCAMGVDELFCMTCKQPTRPYGMMADYVPINDTRGRLDALCAVCEGRCGRLISRKDIPRFAEKLDIATTIGRDA